MGNWDFIQISLEDKDSFKKVYFEHDFDVAMHLGAQASVT